MDSRSHRHLGGNQEEGKKKKNQEEGKKKRKKTVQLKRKGPSHHCEKRR
jgi:hypothetical protein